MNSAGSFAGSLTRGFSDLPDNVSHRHYRWYVVASYAWLTALILHILFVPLFLLIGVKALALINIGSSIVWIIALRLHLKGFLKTSLALGITEIIVHQAMCVIIIGWKAGFQYYLIALASAVFFMPLEKKSSKIMIVALPSILFLFLYYYSQNSNPFITLEPFVTNALNVSILLSFFFLLALISFYYNYAATNAEAALEKEKAKSEEMTALLKKMFGRYLSTEVMNSLIEDPSTLELGGEKRSVTIMITDLRGFTALSERLEPERVVQLLNSYFEIMLEVVLKYNGTINEIIGDSLLIIFGAPQEMPGRALRAIACAIDMQNAMAEVNELNRKQCLPELEMGIGLNETEVIVGNIGSTKRS